MARKGNFNLYGHYAYYVPGIADMVILLVMLLLGALIGNVITFGFQAVLGAKAAMEYGMLVSYPVMFIPAMLYASGKSRSRCLNNDGFKLDSSNFKPVGGALCACLVIVATLASGLVSDAVNSLLPPMPEWLETMLKGMTTGSFWINFLCVSVMAPFFEEWLCRGMVLRGLLGKNMNPVLAVVISALFFAFIHLNPWQAVPAFILGCLFGFVYYKTGSLKLTMLMHFTNNTFSLLIGHIDSLKEYDTWLDMLGTRMYWLMFVLCIIIIALVVLAFRRIPSTSAAGNCDHVAPLFNSENI